MSKQQNPGNGASHRPPAHPEEGKTRVGEPVKADKISKEDKAAMKAAKTPKPRKKVRVGTVIGRIFLNAFKALFVVLCLGIIVGSIVAVQVVQFVVTETQNDDNILDLENIKLAQTSYIMALNPDNPNAAAEDDWIEYQELVGPEHRIWVQLDEIPQDLIDAVVATEDRLFYEHHGVNFERTVYALLNEFFQLEDRTLGSSTIDQQLVKNLTGDDEVGNDGDNTAGYQRKLREIFRSWGLNNRYSKDMIMEAYLNTMGLSETIAGVQAGALEYFGKDVNELTLAECATIAGITKAPTTYSPFQNPQNCLKRRNDVLFFMHDTGKITTKEYESALAEDLGVVRKSAGGGTSSGEIFSFFSDTVFDEVVRDLMEQKGYSRQSAINYIYTGGLRIYATVDLNMQGVLEDMYYNGYEEDGFFLDPNRFPGYERALTVYEQKVDEEGNVIEETTVLPQSACVVLDYDGALQAVIGGIGKKEESLSLNRAVGHVDEDGKVVGTVRQVGSTMKPIAAYALGIDYGIINYSKNVLDAGIQSRNASNPTARDWPSNYSNTYRNSNMPIVSAIAESTNTVAAQVGVWVGREQMYEFLVDTLEISSLVEPNDIDLAPLVLGSMTHGMSAYELAGAYMMFGGNETYGVHNSLHAYSKVADTRGNIVLEPEITTVQAINPQTGYVVNRLLSQVLRGAGLPGGATGTANGMAIQGEMDSVAKTGTTSDDKDRWFVGLTPYYVTAVWWGYDQEHDFMGKWGPSAYTNVPPNVWKYLMETVQADMEYKEFPAAPEGIQELPFCTISGERASAGCPAMMGYYTDFGVPDYCVGHAAAAEPAPAPE